MATTINGLDTYFTNLISNLMLIERQPLERLQTSRDEVKLQRNAYSDLNLKLKDLQSAAKSLRADAATAITIGRKASVASQTAGTTVLTASTASTAAAATYQISVSTLAREHRTWTNQQTAAGQALNLTGSFTLNGATITVGASDNLNSLAAAINSQTYASGQEVKASVVDRRLVIAAQHSGTAAALTAADTSGTVLRSLGVLDAGGAFAAANQQTATDALFYVDGVPVTRSQNSSLTDVIDGVTVNLAADAVGKAATLTVSADTSPARAAVDKFVSQFNLATGYLQAKTGVVSLTDGDKPTYSRGILANDTVFGGLRDKLYFNFMSDVANSGALRNLRDIGLALDDNLQATVIDSAKLEAALSSNLDNAAPLLDAIASRLDELLGGYTGVTTGYLDRSVANFEVQLTETNAAIADMNVRLADKEDLLQRQFGEMQAVLIEMSYQQQQWSTIYGAISQLG